MQGALPNFDYSNLVSLIEGKTFRKSFVKMMKGKNIHSANIKYNNFRNGIPIDGNVYRKFFYDADGHVIKKFYFNQAGDLEMKDQFVFDKSGKILFSKFINSSEIWEERFKYDDKQQLSEYEFNNPRWIRPKKEEYEWDKYGRKAKKVSFGLLGQPEIVTEYLYENSKAKKYKYRYVTKPDGTLIITFLYTYDDKQNHIGLFGFALHPDEVSELMKSNKQWVLESDFSSTWKYDDNNNATEFIRDEKLGNSKPIWFENAEYGYSFKQNRAVTSRSNSEFTEINGNYYLVKTTEWLPRFHEPLQAIKEYSYYDENGGIIYPPPPKKDS